VAVTLVTRFGDERALSRDLRGRGERTDEDRCTLVVPRGFVRNGLLHVTALQQARDAKEAGG